jgi:hypothetical protein
VPSGNGLYLLSMTHDSAGLPSHNVERRSRRSVALAAEFDPALWHSRMGHLDMHSLQAQHSNNTTSAPSMPCYVIYLSCESCNLNKAASAPRNRTASLKLAPPLEKFSCNLWGHVHVPSSYGLRYCLVVIDHQTNFMWVRFLKSKDKTCSKLRQSCWTHSTTTPYVTLTYMRLSQL